MNAIDIFRRMFRVGRGFEEIVDDTGWKFHMPILTYEDVERLGLGTMELADFVFGTPLCIGFIPPRVARCRKPECMRSVERFIWRIENIFRCIRWTLTLEGRNRILMEYIDKVRHMLFKIGWWITVSPP